MPAIAGITNVAMAFPLPESFQTPLVRVTLDGVNYYLNDTDQYAQLGSTGSDGALGIALSTGAWEIIHAAKDCEDATRTDYTLLLDDSGRTLLQVSQWYYGENYSDEEPVISPNCRPKSGNGIFRKPFPRWPRARDRWAI